MKKTVTKIVLASTLMVGSILTASETQDKGMSSLYMGSSTATYKNGSNGKTKITFGGDFMPFQVLPNHSFLFYLEQ